jgi:mycothiol synthase
MVLSHRPYETIHDYYALAAAHGQWLTSDQQHLYMHPGDVAHRLSSGLRGAPASEAVGIWCDGDDLVAWTLFLARSMSLDITIDPDHEEIFENVLNQVTSDIQARFPNQGFGVEIDESAASRIRTAKGLGFVPLNEPYVLTSRAVANIPTPSLPTGYRIVASSSVDIDVIIEAHNGSFGSSWTAATYGAVQGHPGRSADLELIALAPDGSAAGFTVVWCDPVSRIGLFEPVGTHRDHQRLGIGTALIVSGLEEMHRHEMQSARVTYEATNPAPRALYHSLGFRDAARADEYRLE